MTMDPAKKTDELAKKQTTRPRPNKADQHGSRIDVTPTQGTASLLKDQNNSEMSTCSGLTSSHPEPKIVQKPHTAMDREESGSSRRERPEHAADPNQARPGSSGSITAADSKEPEPHIPVVHNPRPPVFGIGRQDEQGNTLFLGAGALAKIMNKRKDQLENLRGRRAAGQLEQAEQ